MENKGHPHSPPKSYSLEVAVKPSSSLLSLLPHPLLFVVILVISTIIFSKVEAFGQVVDHLIAKSVNMHNYKWHVQTTNAHPRSCFLLEAKQLIWMLCGLSYINHNLNALSMISSLHFFKAGWRVKTTYKANVCRLSVDCFSFSSSLLIFPSHLYCNTSICSDLLFTKHSTKHFQCIPLTFQTKTPVISHIF